jgi:hypothetical protein
MVNPMFIGPAGIIGGVDLAVVAWTIHVYISGPA